MKSAVKAKIIFLTSIGTILLPVLFSISSDTVDFIFKNIGNKKFPDLWSKAVWSIADFWEKFFPKESYPLPVISFHANYHSEIVKNMTDFTVLFFCGLISYLLAKSFIKDGEAENLSIC